MLKRRLFQFAVLLTIGVCIGSAKELPDHQTDFPPEEFVERRDRIFDQIGDNAIVLLQAAASVRGFNVFRQSNQFYYLTGLETPHSYLLMNGRNRQTILYLPHRDERLERGEGTSWSAQTPEEVKKLTGVDAVLGYDQLGKQFFRFLIKTPYPTLYTPFSPAEGTMVSRDEALIGLARAIADPWDEALSREGRFINLIRTRFPQFEMKDLSPILDEMRLVKSEREIALIRRASELAGLGIIEAIRSTKPDVMEYQLDAAARYIFRINGSRGPGYRSITAGGTNAWMGHYSQNSSPVKDGDLILMDFAPDYRYYTSDVARMWPVNGKFTPAQRELYGFIVEYYKVLQKYIRPHVSADQIMDEAAAEMKKVFESTKFSKPIYEKACRDALTFRGHLSHPVGLAVHDVGTYRRAPIQPGTVFSIDPMIWVPEEKLYIRVEDVGVVTEDGFENFSSFVPTEIEDIEKLMQEEGILQHKPTDDRTSEQLRR